MCIQWCCKNCPNKLTILRHRWARERCNDYFIARSKDQSVTDCPTGAWELQRAFHRHPYRGAQRCDDCIKAGRKESKLSQSARQRANVVLGDRPEYTGALYVGELEIPDNFHRVPRPVEPGQLDALKSNWENFALANAHLPPHELEREWATWFARYNIEAWNQSAKHTSTFNQHTRGDEPNLDVEEVSQSPRQQVQHHHIPQPYKGACANAEEEISRDAHGGLRKCDDSNPDESTSKHAIEEASQNQHHTDPQNNNFPANHTDCATAHEKASPEPQRGMQNNPRLVLRAFPQSTRARPWDL